MVSPGSSNRMASLTQGATGLSVHRWEPLKLSQNKAFCLLRVFFPLRYLSQCSYKWVPNGGGTFPGVFPVWVQNRGQCWSGSLCSLMGLSIDLLWHLALKGWRQKGPRKINEMCPCSSQDAGQIGLSAGASSEWSQGPFPRVGRAHSCPGESSGALRCFD